MIVALVSAWGMHMGQRSLDRAMPVFTPSQAGF